MSAEKRSPPREAFSGGLGVPGCSGPQHRTVPKIPPRPLVRQARSLPAAADRGRSNDGGPVPWHRRHRGARAYRQGARQAGCLARRDCEGVSQVAASPGHPSLSPGPDATSDPTGKHLSEGDGASPRLPSLSPHLWAERMKQKRKKRLKQREEVERWKESTQVAAMALAFLIEVCGPEGSGRA